MKICAVPRYIVLYYLKNIFSLGNCFGTKDHEVFVFNRAQHLSLVHSYPGWFKQNNP